MPPGAREREQVVDTRRHLDDLRLGRPAAPHRHDEHVPVAREQPRHVAGDRRLADALARPDHRQRGQRERLQLGGLEAEVGADVRQAGRERLARPAHPLGRAKHRFVGEVDDDVGRAPVEPVHERHPVVLPAPQLLRPAYEHRPDQVVRQLRERVPHDRSVVLAVDQGYRPH